VPWAPRQDFEYLLQIIDFKFYSPIPKIHDDAFWEYCSRLGGLIIGIPCNELLLSEFTPFGEYLAYDMDDRGKLTNNTKNHLGFLKKWLSAFPQNGSGQIFKELIGGLKVAIVELNSQIDDILSELNFWSQDGSVVGNQFYH